VTPTVTSSDTIAPTIMIAEKGMAFILDEARQQLAPRNLRKGQTRWSRALVRHGADAG